MKAAKTKGYRFVLGNRSHIVPKHVECLWWQQIKSSDSLSEFAKSRKATTVFALLRLTVRVTVCPSVRLQQLGSQWKDFHAIWYLRTSRIYVDKIQVALLSSKNSEYFSCRRTHIYDRISPNSSRNAKCCRQSSRDNQSTHYILNVFKKSCSL